MRDDRPFLLSLAEDRLDCKDTKPTEVFGIIADMLEEGATDEHAQLVYRSLSSAETLLSESVRWPDGSAGPQEYHLAAKNDKDGTSLSVAIVSTTIRFCLNEAIEHRERYNCQSQAEIEVVKKSLYKLMEVEPVFRRPPDGYGENSKPRDFPPPAGWSMQEKHIPD